MSTVTVAVVAAIAIAAGIALAFVPLKLLMDVIARNVAEPIKRFIERQRERRKSDREAPDRRKRGDEPS